MQGGKGTCISCRGWGEELGKEVAACFIGQIDCDRDRYDCTGVPGWSEPVGAVEVGGGDGRVAGWVGVALAAVVGAVWALGANRGATNANSGKVKRGGRKRNNIEKQKKRQENKGKTKLLRDISFNYKEN